MENRRGKWSIEEEQYAEKIIEDFDNGLLPIDEGTTLRSLLSHVLRCDPMRVTKKYSGKNSIGKRVFRPVLMTPENAIRMQESQMLLMHLKEKWTVCRSFDKKKINNAPNFDPTTSNNMPLLSNQQQYQLELDEMYGNLKSKQYNGLGLSGNIYNNTSNGNNNSSAMNSMSFGVGVYGNQNPATLSLANYNAFTASQNQNPYSSSFSNTDADGIRMNAAERLLPNHGNHNYISHISLPIEREAGSSVADRNGRSSNSSVNGAFSSSHDTLSSENESNSERDRQNVLPNANSHLQPCSSNYSAVDYSRTNGDDVEADNGFNSEIEKKYMIASTADSGLKHSPASTNTSASKRKREDDEVGMGEKKLATELTVPTDTQESHLASNDEAVDVLMSLFRG